MLVFLTGCSGAQGNLLTADFLENEKVTPENFSQKLPVFLTIVKDFYFNCDKRWIETEKAIELYEKQPVESLSGQLKSLPVDDDFLVKVDQVIFLDNSKEKITALKKYREKILGAKDAAESLIKILEVSILFEKDFDISFCEIINSSLAILTKMLPTIFEGALKRKGK
jgi:hypothetical protein